MEVRNSTDSSFGARPALLSVVTVTADFNRLAAQAAIVPGALSESVEVAFHFTLWSELEVEIADLPDEPVRENRESGLPIPWLAPPPPAMAPTAPAALDMAGAIASIEAPHVPADTGEVPDAPRASAPLPPLLAVGDTSFGVELEGEAPASTRDQGPSVVATKEQQSKPSERSSMGGEAQSGAEPAPSSIIPDLEEPVSETSFQELREEATPVIAAPSTPAETRPGQKPPHAAAPELLTSVEEPAAPQRIPVREVSLELNTDQARVGLQIREAGGKVEVTVRTPDPALAMALRLNLDELSSNLERRGIEAHVWTPLDERAFETQSSSGSGDRESAGHGDGNWRGGADQERDTPDDPRSGRQWLEDLGAEGDIDSNADSEKEEVNRWLLPSQTFRGRR